jgi:hypothetical protein
MHHFVLFRSLSPPWSSLVSLHQAINSKEQIGLLCWPAACNHAYHGMICSLPDPVTTTIILSMTSHLFQSMNSTVIVHDMVVMVGTANSLQSVHGLLTFNLQGHLHKSACPWAGHLRPSHDVHETHLLPGMSNKRSGMAYPHESTRPSSGPYYLVPLPLVLPADLEKWLDSTVSTPKHLVPHKCLL